MKQLPWIVVPLMLIAAALLVADVGSAGLWIAVITVSIVLVVDHVRTTAS